MGNAYSTLKKEGTKMSGGDQHVLLVGNPGTGKSTIVNGIVGRVVFRSGFSAGTGMTTCMQTVEHEGVIYSDTPGLDDVNTRETAGREIATALRQNGTYRLIFVVTLEAGRVRSADIATMKIVLDAIDLPTEVPFGIIINKLSKKAMTKLGEEENRKTAFASMQELGANASHIFLNEFDVELMDVDDALADVPPALLEFIQNLPALYIGEESVTDLKLDEMEELKEKFEAELAEAIKAENARTAQLEQEAARARAQPRRVIHHHHGSGGGVVLSRKVRGGTSPRQHLWMSDRDFAYPSGEEKD